MANGMALRAIQALSMRPRTPAHVVKPSTNLFSPTCSHIPSNLWQQLPAATADVNPIDHALSSIPDLQDSYPLFWSALLTIL
jgi:hypothetical protein